MSAWTKGLANAPLDKPILVRMPGWECPAVMHHDVNSEGGFWAFSEQVLSDIEGGLNPGEEQRAEWAPIPN